MQEAYMGLFPLVWIAILGSLFLSLGAWRAGCYPHTAYPSSTGAY